LGTGEFESLRLSLDDGHVLYGARMLPDRIEPRACIQICHGLAEHGDRYRRFAAALAAAGYATYVYDLRGHGQQAANVGTLGVFAQENGAQKIIGDQFAVAEHIAGEHPSAFLVLIGHSLGALIGANVVLRRARAFNAALLMNTDFHGGALRVVAKAALFLERSLRGDEAAGWFAPKATFTAWNRQFRPNRTQFDWLSRDPAEVDKYTADPLCGWDPSVSMWRDVAELVDFTANDGNLASSDAELPIHLISGTRDYSSHQGKATTAFAARLRNAGWDRVTTRIYDGARHETLNDTHRNAATADIIAWLDSILA
jgi:alpha-beta hydrolase superfamily lysophospholipase